MTVIYFLCSNNTIHDMCHLISVHIQRSLLSVCEICNLCTFLDKYLSRHYFMIGKLRYFTQIYLVVALKHHVMHYSKVLVSWRQAYVFHNVLYNSSFLQARCTYINKILAQTRFLRTLTKTIYISVIFSTLNLILSVANLSRLECAEISFA